MRLGGVQLFLVVMGAVSRSNQTFLVLVRANVVSFLDGARRLVFGKYMSKVASLHLSFFYLDLSTELTGSFKKRPIYLKRGELAVRMNAFFLLNKLLFLLFLFSLLAYVFLLVL